MLAENAEKLAENIATLNQHKAIAEDTDKP